MSICSTSSLGVVPICTSASRIWPRWASASTSLRCVVGQPSSSAIGRGAMPRSLLALPATTFDRLPEAAPLPRPRRAAAAAARSSRFTACKVLCTSSISARVGRSAALAPISTSSCSAARLFSSASSSRRCASRNSSERCALSSRSFTVAVQRSSSSRPLPTGCAGHGRRLEGRQEVDIGGHPDPARRWRRTRCRAAPRRPRTGGGSAACGRDRERPPAAAGPARSRTAAPGRPRRRPASCAGRAAAPPARPARRRPRATAAPSVQASRTAVEAGNGASRCSRSAVITRSGCSRS